MNQFQGSELSYKALKYTQLKINVIVHEEAFVGSVFLNFWINEESTSYFKITLKKKLCFCILMFFMNAILNLQLI